MGPSNVAARRSGLTMVEVMISAALLAIASLALIQTFLSSLTLDELNRERLVARQACRRELESILAMNYGTVESANNRSFDVKFDVKGDGSRVVTLKPPAGRAKVGLVTVDTTASGDVMCPRVTVEAKWRSVTTGQPVTLTITSSLAEH